MVVSLLSHSTSIHTLTHPLFFNPNHPHRLRPQFHPPLRRTTLSFSSPKKNSSSLTNSPIPPQKLPRTLFPGGYKRPELKIPNLILQLSPEEVLEDRTTLDSIDGAVSGRVGIVVLNGGAGSGGRLYEASCLLKSVIRDRAYLMIAERVDIAAAVNASGVVLSDQGLPTIVARNTMMDSRSDSVVLPLVARNVQISDVALNASNSDGADFLIYGIAGEKHAEEPLSSVRESVKVPIFVTIPSLGSDTLFNEAGKYLKSGASGFVVSLEESNSRNVERFQGAGNLETLDVDNGFPGKKGVAGFSKLEDRE